MGRAINNQDPYLSRVLKHIPSEIVMAYVAIEGVVRTAYDNNPTQLTNALWIVCVALLALTPLWMWRVMKVTSRLQIGLSILSVLVWMFAIGGPFLSLRWYEPALGAIALPLYTLLMPVITGKQTE